MAATPDRRPRRITATLTTVGTVLAVATLVLATACSHDQDTGPVNGFANLFVGYSVDYQPVDGPAALVPSASLVVQGRIDRVGPGRTFGTAATDPAAASTIVMAVGVDRVLHGTLPTNATGVVYVELPAPGGAGADQFDRLAPKSSDAVLYLSPAPTAAQTPIVNPEAGRPAGQPLYQPVSPQAFFVAAGTEVVQVLEYTRFDGASLRSFGPDSERFPRARPRTPHD